MNNEEMKKIVKRNVEILLKKYNEEIKRKYKDEKLAYLYDISQMRDLLQKFVNGEIEFDEIFEEHHCCPANELGKYETECDKYELHYEFCTICWVNYLRTDWRKQHEEEKN